MYWPRAFSLPNLRYEICSSLDGFFRDRFCVGDLPRFEDLSQGLLIDSILRLRCYRMVRVEAIMANYFIHKLIQSRTA